MECRALSDPAGLAQLIAELEGSTLRPWRQSAAVCFSRSVDDPGRSRLWVVPQDAKAGANPGLWVRNNRELFNELVDNSVAHSTVVFPGGLPRSTERHWVDVYTRAGAGQPPTTQASRSRIRRYIRAVSAPTHLWVDRIRVLDESGNIDEQGRREKLQLWAAKSWTKEMDEVYIPPNLRAVEDGSGPLGETAIANLLAGQPSCLDKGLVVIYGHGGAGKTFFLSRIGDRLAGAASSSLIACIPVFVPLAGVLHRYALENWLARNGFGALTLGQITCLLRRGVIVPLLDALDEAVKGEARQGSEEFLDHLVQLTTSDAEGRGVLACRDYYLTTDRTLVRERLRGLECAEVSIGPFDRQDTRRFIQARTGLAPEHASRWADALEKQAQAIVGEEEEELEVVRHPVVLDMLARYIRELPPGSRMTAVDEFRLSRGDIFGEIVDELLKRERQKHAPLWQEAFAGRLEPEWMDPFDHEKQRAVLRDLTLLVAHDGGAACPAEAAQEFRHGVYLNTRGVPEADNPREALEGLVCQILGLPRVAGGVPEEEKSEVQNSAVRHLAEAYAAHILASTDPNRPDRLVFALRHRFYFDYFLADALLTEIERALRSGHSRELVEWCLDHHIGGRFDRCLDFLAWDPRIARDGVDRLREVFRAGHISEDILASYLISLSLAVFLRRQVPGRERVVEMLQLAANPNLEILLMKEFLPDEVSHVSLASCSFPKVTIDSVDLTDISVESCELQELRIVGTPRTRISRCKLANVECCLFRLGGTVVFSETDLDIEGDIVVDEGAHIELYTCAMTKRVAAAFEAAKQAGAGVLIEAPKTIEEATVPPTAQSPGRRFVNRLMGLLRKEGHATFGVYIYKLRDKTPGSDDQFTQALELLRRQGCVEMNGPIVVMTAEGAAHMYQRRLADKAGYELHEAYWDPIIEALDKILT